MKVVWLVDFFIGRLVFVGFVFVSGVLVVFSNWFFGGNVCIDTINVYDF